MAGTLITAFIILGSVALFIGLFRYVHKRDQRRDAAREQQGS